MKNKITIPVTLMAVTLMVVSGFMMKPKPATPVKVFNASVLAFGPDNVLFIGDSKEGVVHAVKTEATALKDPVPFNMEDLDLQIAKKLKVNPRDIRINDLKIHPVSQEAYIAVRNGMGPEAQSVVAIVSPVNPEIRLLDVNSANSNSVTVKNTASDKLMFWNETPASNLSITDIDFHNGHIYVSGLSNGEFASTLRKIQYPFSGSQEAVKGIEMYHAVHTQNETRAPIRTMLVEEVNGKPTLLASYTCTPLVAIPAAEVKQGNHVVGKTIAELGYGNAPIDMLTVSTQGQDGQISKSLLITHYNRGGSLIPFESVVSGVQGAGLAGTQASAPAGLEGMIEIPTANVMQIDVQNQMFLAMLRRNISTGSIDLVSELTGVYLRLSDFISEYDFPDYKYDEKQAQTKQFHDMVKPMEGYPDLVSEKEGK